MPYTEAHTLKHIHTGAETFNSKHTHDTSKYTHTYTNTHAHTHTHTYARNRRRTVQPAVKAVYKNIPSHTANGKHPFIYIRDKWSSQTAQ